MDAFADDSGVWAFSGARETESAPNGFRSARWSGAREQNGAARTFRSGWRTEAEGRVGRALPSAPQNFHCSSKLSPARSGHRALRSARGLAPAAARLRQRALPFALRSRPPIDFVHGGLVGGFDDQFVDTNMRRPAGDPEERFGNVFACQRDHPFVNLFGACRVAFEADQ